MRDGRAESGVGGWRRDAFVVGIALLAGLILRVWFLVHAPKVTGDGLMYGDLARNWFWHGIYGLTWAGGIRPTLIRLPGYPLFLGACFALFQVENYRAVMMVQVAIDLFTCVLLAATAGRLFGRRAEVAALWLGVACPFSANYVATVLTETLSIFCVAVTFYGLVRWDHGGRRLDRWVCVVGVGLAYAVLLRPEQGLLAVAVAPVMAWCLWGSAGGGRRFVPVLVAALLTVAPLGPWAVRNWVRFHVVQPLAPRNANDPGEAVPVGFQRWFRTWGVDAISNDQVYWNYDNDVILVSNLPSRAFDSAGQFNTTVTLLDEYNATTTATSAFDARFAELAGERVKASWWRYYVGLPVMRLLDMLFRPRTELLVIPMDWWRWRQHWSGSAIAFGYSILNVGYFALAALGFRRSRRTGGWVVFAMVLFCVLRCGMLATIDNSEPRYTLELFPVLIVLGSAMFEDRFAAK